MKITGLETSIVQIPETDPLASMPEDGNRKRPFVTLRLRTDAEIEGIAFTLYGDAMTGSLRTAVDELGALCLGEDPLNIERIVNRTMTLVTSPEVGEFAGTLMDLMHRFETMTGLPCVGLFEESGQPLPLNIRLMLQQFVDGGGLSRFPPGVRYFFGRPVPSNSRTSQP